MTFAYSNHADSTKHFMGLLRYRGIFFGNERKTTKDRSLPPKKYPNSYLHSYLQFHPWKWRKPYLVAHPTARKWVINPVISGLTLLIPFITGVITHLRAVGWATKYPNPRLLAELRLVPGDREDESLRSASAKRVELPAKAKVMILWENVRSELCQNYIYTVYIIMSIYWDQQCKSAS